MISIQRIKIDNPLYEKERELRNKILLRPIGVPDNAWEMHDEKSWHFVALDKNKVIGCVVLVPLDDKNNKVQLIQMAVEDSYQRKGIGKKMVHELVEFSKSIGINQIVCHAREDAVQFYLNMDFEIYNEAFEEVGILHRHMRKFNQAFILSMY